MGLPSRAAIAAVLAVLGWAIPAGAHEEHALHALTVLRSVSPDIEGVEVRIVHLDAPALFVRNDTDRLLTVLGSHGERFLEISSDGVRANSESPTTYLSAAPRAENVPPGLDPAGRPRWVTFSEERSWTWFDPRLRAGESDEWEVRLLLDGQPIEIVGGFESLHGHGHFVSELDAPDVEGLDLRLTQGSIPAVFVRNDTGRVLSVPGETGEPFLRIGSRGVFANLRSPTYYTSGATSILKVPRSADATAPPRWSKVSPDPVWAWLERRGAVPAELYERDELGESRHPVLEWSAPYRLGDETIEVSGRVLWIPPAAAPSETGSVGVGARWLLPVAVAAAVLAVAAAVLARRRVTHRPV
ncbi:MAG TPA: hypothetical protein VJ927_09095 [Actinomycetota bacterium]|nr:hypothetical protein [Actinomycetota bacterium]